MSNSIQNQSSNEQINVQQSAPVQPVFQVPLSDAIGFSKVWTYKGLAIPIKEEHVQFAADFANVVLRNFIVQCQLQAAQARIEQSKVENKKLIVEGLG